ncbi:hypothetical protein [Clostridium sp.]|uniref:hypothetical protein n=1 Tax=Clostridium sp. TaxID=1506 RepID=UPI003F2C842C
MTTVTILSLIIGLLFIIYSIITFKANGILFDLFVRDEFIKKSYISKVKIISGLLTALISFIFAYYSYYNLIEGFFIIFLPFVYIISRRIFIIIYEYVDIRKLK